VVIDVVECRRSGTLCTWTCRQSHSIKNTFDLHILADARILSLQVFIHVFTDMIDLCVKRVRVGIETSIEKLLQETHAPFNGLE